MEIKSIPVIKNKEEARNNAIKWQKWQSEKSLSYGEILKWQNYFEIIAKRFGLKKEFKENGII